MACWIGQEAVAAAGGDGKLVCRMTSVCSQRIEGRPTLAAAGAEIACCGAVPVTQQFTEHRSHKTTSSRLISHRHAAAECRTFAPRTSAPGPNHSSSLTLNPDHHRYRAACPMAVVAVPTTIYPSCTTVL